MKTIEETLIPEVVEEEGEKEKFQPSTKVKKGRGRGTTKRRLSVKYRLIAEKAARGFNPEMIAKDNNLSVAQVYKALKKDEVWEHIAEIIKEIFSEGDRLLANLFKKGLISLDTDLISDDPDVRKNTREQLFKLWGYSKGGESEGGTHHNIIQQFFQAKGSGGVVKSMDEIILEKRKERGLSIPKQIENKRGDEEDD